MKTLLFILRTIILLLAVMTLLVIVFACSDTRTGSEEKVIVPEHSAARDSAAAWCEQCVQRAVKKGADSTCSRLMCASLYLREECHYIETSDYSIELGVSGGVSEEPSSEVRYHRRKWVR
jgi:hypothetical protein